MLALRLAVALSTPTTVPPGPPADAPHSIVLSTRLGRSDDDSVTGQLQVTGIQVTPRLIAVSTNAVKGQLPVAVRDAISPQRLAIKLAESTRSQYWKVSPAGGSITQGQVRFVDTTNGIAIVELVEPLAAWSPCEGPKKAEEQPAILRSGRVEGEYGVELRPSPSGRWDVTTPVPREFESSIAYDGKGRCLGLVVGASSPGAAYLLEPDQLVELVEELRRVDDRRRPELRWSGGLGLGTAIGPEVQVRTTFISRADLLIDRRWGFGVEASWQAFQRDEVLETPSYRELNTRTHHIVLGGLMSYIFGSRAQAVRPSLSLGAGLDLQIHDERGRTLTVAEGCDGTAPCPLDVSTDRRLSTTPRPDLIVGGDLLGIRPARKRGLVGIRVGYRAHLIIPDPFAAFHAVTVTVQF